MLFRIRQILLHVSPLEHFDVQEAESADVQNNSIDSQLPLAKKVGMVTPDVVRAELIERRVDVLPEMLYRFQIGLNRRCSVVAADEFFSHPLNKCRHRGVLSQ